jgi:hypothetical protein
LPNKILRHIHKKKDFEPFPAHLQSKCAKSANKNKNFILLSKKISKNPEFHADFESVEKVLKKLTPKKLLAKT